MNPDQSAPKAFSNPYPANTLYPKMLSAFYNCYIYIYIQMSFRLLLIMEANTMNPDQTAPKEQSDLGSYCLPNRPPKNISSK